MPIPQFTLCPGGFVVTRPLDDGRTLVEGWVFTAAPWDGSTPCHEPAYHWIAATGQEAADLVAEFAENLAQPIPA